MKHCGVVHGGMYEHFGAAMARWFALHWSVSCVVRASL